MKQITFASILLAAATLFAGCSKDAPGELTKQDSKENITTLDAGSLRFNFVEEGFGEDIEQTRGEELPKEEIVDVGNGLEAHISVERDAVPATRAPKPIADGNYTIVAYKGTQRLDQKITFKVVGGVTSVTSTKGRYSWVANETYTFVCYNDKMYEQFGYLYTQINDFTGGLFDRQTITINGVDQNLTFQMKHTSFRVRTKIVTLPEYPVITSASFPAGYFRMLAGRYDLFTGAASNHYDGPTATAVPQTYVNSGTYTDADLQDDLYTVTAKEYDYYVSGTQATLHLSCTAATIYGKSVNFTHEVSMKPDAFKANGSYTVVIKLMPKYLYLFEDGETGYLSDAGHKIHVPIAVVFDITGRRAIALWNANGGRGTQWANDKHFQRNSKMFQDINMQSALNDNEDGRYWTWNASSDKDGKIKANETVTYPAFYYAGNFYQSSDLTDHLNGKTLATNLNQAGVWYLGSGREWGEMFQRLGFCDISKLVASGTWESWKGSLVNYAFRNPIANGTTIVGRGDIYDAYYYWTSVETYYNSAYGKVPRYALSMYTFRTGAGVNSAEKNWVTPYVRPFVAY